MTPEQEVFWRKLKLDPEDYAHDSARELLSVSHSNDLFNELADRHLLFVMNNFNNYWTLRIVKTWLSKYSLPFEPSKLTSFDRFHTQFHDQVKNDAKNILSL